jgi:N-dimethylarginine dimethylaminohydrolase
MTPMDEIYVDYEYGNLREIIVGVPVMRYPDVGRAAWVTEALEVLPPAEAAKLRERSGLDSRDLPKYEAMEAENRALIDVLQRFDVTVHRPSPITDETVAANFGHEWLVNGYIQTYSRDPIFVVADNVIELAPGAPNRRADLLGYRGLFDQRVAGSGAKWVQMPAVDAAAMVAPGYTKDGRLALEGGDLLVLGDTVLAGTTLNPAVGSSTSGVDWLRNLLGRQGFVVERVPLERAFLHLDVCLSIPRDGLAIVCPDALVDGLPAQLDGWDLIEVTADQARLLACNGLPIDPDNYILGYNDDEDGSTVQAGLEAHGITVHRVPFGNHTEDGGSIRCSTHPLVRRLATG